MITVLLRIALICLYVLFLIIIYGLCIFTVPGLLMMSERLRKPLVFLLAALISAALFFGGAAFLASHPRITIPPEYDPYIEEWMVDEMRDTFQHSDLFLLSIPLSIRVVSASETHFAAEASYSGFGGKLGMARTFRDGIWYGELYEP